MKIVSKEMFLKILKFRPQSLIGKEIIYDGYPQRIYDISLSGDYIFMDKGNYDKDWYVADSLDDPVVIDEIDLTRADGKKIFTVKTVTEDIENIKKLIGQPADGQSLSLFEMADALYKRVIAMEHKELTTP